MLTTFFFWNAFLQPVKFYDSILCFMFLLLLSTSFLLELLHIIAFLLSLAVVVYLSCHSLFLLLFSFPLFWSLCCPVSTLARSQPKIAYHWPLDQPTEKTSSISLGLRIVTAVFLWSATTLVFFFLFSSPPYIHRPNESYFLAFTVYQLLRPDISSIKYS